MSTSPSKKKSSSTRRDKDDTTNPDVALPRIGNYNFVKTVGEGNFAKVKLATHKITGAEVAIKVIDKTTMDEKKISKLYREVRIMKMLHHPNIVRLYEVIETKYTVFLVMEYASGGELYDYLVVHGKMKEKDARAKFRQILSAVNYCHQKRVIHRDLKAENLLLDANLEIKIADFGFSNYFDPDTKLDTFCGSPPYAAPELFQGRRYTGPEVDIWSLGVILYVLTTGCLPFDGKNLAEMRESVCKGKYRIPFFLTEGCEKLLKKFLARDAEKRNNLEMLIDDSWINEGYSNSPITPGTIEVIIEDEGIIKLMEGKYKYERSAIVEALRGNVYNEITAVYFLLYSDKESKGAGEQDSNAAEVTMISNPNPKHESLTNSEKEKAMPKIGEEDILEDIISPTLEKKESILPSHKASNSATANFESNENPQETHGEATIRKRAQTVHIGHKKDAQETISNEPSIAPEEQAVQSATTGSPPEIDLPSVKRHNTIQGMIRGLRPGAVGSGDSGSQPDDKNEDTDKPRSLRFTFNSNTTSSKSPDEIVVELIKAGNKLNLTHRLITRYLLECSSNAPLTPGKEVLKIEVEVCKLPRLNNLHGLRFKRIGGSSADYKDVSEQILATIQL